MDQSPPFLKCYPADARTSWIAIQVLIGVGILFGAAFGLKTYAATLDPSWALAEFLGASLFAFFFVSIGVGFVACSMRPVVFSRDGIRRWLFPRFPWAEIETYELHEQGEWGSGCCLILHTSSDAFPIDFARWGFVLRTSDSSQVVAIMQRMGVPDKAPLSLSQRAGTRYASPIAPTMKEHALARSPEQRGTEGIAGRAGTISARKECGVLLNLGEASRPYRWLAVGVILATVAGLIVAFGFPEWIAAAGISDSVAGLILMGGLVCSLVALVGPGRMSGPASLTDEGVMRWPWLSKTWDQIEAFDIVRRGHSLNECFILFVYPRGGGLKRSVYYWTGRMPNADRWRIEQIMEEKRIPERPSPSSF